MRIQSKISKFQQGGPAPAPQDPNMPAAEQQTQDPMAQLLAVAAQAVQTQNCEAAMAVCQTLVQLAQGGEPQPAPSEPTFARNGGKFTKI